MTAIPRNAYRYIEAELYDYPIRRKVLEAYKRDIIEGTPSGDESGVRGSGGGSVVESKVLMLLSDREVQRLERSIAAIEDTLATLNPDQREMVKLKYFANTHTHQGVMLVMHLPERTYHRYKDDIIRKFAIRYGLI